jgi:hypothetical protein
MEQQRWPFHEMRSQHVGTSLSEFESGPSEALMDRWMARFVQQQLSR